VGVVGVRFGTDGASTTVFLVGGDVTTAWIGAMDDTDFRNGIMIVTGGGIIVAGGGIGELDVGDDGIAIGAAVGVVVVVVVTTTTGWSVVGTDVMV
jgi:cyanophycinase-like exopeptidase